MSERSHELDLILAQFLESAENGQGITRDDLIRQNPSFADALRAFFANQDALGDLTAYHPNDPNESARSTHSPQEGPGSIIHDRYKLIECIGEGGMGTVWVAEQFQPIRRKVAIKLVKAGMDSKQVLARFDAERQALAMMDHPNIAKVFDGGVTELGRPFFVMEYVKGIPFTEYCDKAKLSLKERLQLFIPICQAVQHAHHKGIVHRDLKPSNILLCLYDGKAIPKVIDFGLAKAMHQPLTEMSIYTNHGMMVGTPLYMSPEQAELNNLDIDTRTDVYSLGVVLYELLTGTTPLERQQLHEAAYNEVLRLIKEVDPLRPSMKLSGSASLPSIAAQRSIEPKELRRTLAGDLDWIVMKALEKERSRRYETANGLARDIERFLNEEAIEACPPSSTYRLKKVLKKHRGKVIAAGLFATTLLLGIIGTTLGFIASSRSAKKLKESNAALTDFSNGLLTVIEHGYAEMQDISEGNSRYETPDFEIYAEFKNGKTTSTNSTILQSLESKSTRERILSELDEWLTFSIRGEKKASQLLDRESYRVGLQAAYTAIENGELISAQSWLNELPEALRGWEWNWLMAETDKSLFQTPIPDGKYVEAVSRDGLYCVLKDQQSTTELQVMDSKSGKLTSKIVLPEAKRILGVALSKDASLCIISAALEVDSAKGLRSSLFVWDTKSEKVIRRYDSGFDLNNFLFTIGILECSDSGRQISASCYGQLGRSLDEMTSKVIRDFNVMSDYVVFDLDEDDSTPTFYGEASLGPDGTVYTKPKLPPASTAMILQHSEANEDEVCTELKFSPDGTMVFRCINEVWSEKRKDGSSSVLGEFSSFEHFEFYDDGELFVGIKNGQLSYSLTAARDTEFTLGSIENEDSIYIDEQGRFSIVYGDKINFYPLPNRKEVARLKSIQFTSQPINSNLISTGMLPASPAELAGMNAAGHPLAKLLVYRDVISMAAVNIQMYMGLMETTKSGHLIWLNESDCYLNRLQISSQESYKSVDRVKVLDTLPYMSHYSNPNREYPVSSKASDDGRLYLTVLAPTQSARLFECESGKLLWKKDSLGNEAKPLFVDDHVAVFYVDSSLQRFELKGEKVLRFDAPRRITAASVSPDNKLIACVSAGSVYLIDTVTMEEVKRWSISQSGAYFIEWGLNGARLFVYSYRSTCICDPNEGSVILNFSIGRVDDHNLTPQTDLAVFGGRIVSSRPFREHWRIWHETWQKEDTEDAKKNKTQAVQLLTQVLSQSKGLYDNWSEFKDLTNQQILSEPGLSVSDRLSAITTLAKAIKFFNSQNEKLPSEVREEYVAQITKHATEKLQLDEPAEKIYRQLAAVWFDCRTSLNDRAWLMVKHPNKTASEYADGLLVATEAVKRLRNHAVLNTLAVAQYRNSQYTECLETLAEASKTLGAELKSYPSDILFEAMANFRLGNIEKAQSILAEFRSRPSEDLNDEDRAFLQEAMELIENILN